MLKLRAVKELLAGRLAVAAEELFSAHTSDVPAEQQRAAVQRRLTLVADEICKILEVMMNEHEAEQQNQQLDVPLKTETRANTADRPSLPASDCEQSGHVQRTSDRFRDAATETDCDFICSNPSQLTSAVTETGDHANLSPNNSGATSEDGEKPLKSNKRKKCQRQSEAEGSCHTCGRPFNETIAGKKIKKQESKTSATASNQTVSQSCCRVCGKFFRYKRSFLKHVLAHEQSSDMCGACGKHLDPDESLKVHLETHNEENICRDQTEDNQSEAERSDAESKVCDSDEDWMDNEESDSEEGDSERDQTKDCSEKSKPKGSNKQTGSKNKDYKDSSHLKYCCKVCGKAFCYRASFLKHVQEDEGDTDVCGVCGKRFESEDSLRLHLQTYIRTNDCEVCGKHFDGHKQLEMHMRTHTGEKPYVCTFCGKAFAQNGNLMGHMRGHTGEKPYVCSMCGQSFSFKEYMMAHMRIHTGEKPFLCSVCGKGFRQRGTLKTHMMIHTGESTHRCSFCDKKFYKSGALKIHMRSHTGEKPYLCNVCGKSFTASGSLTKHMTKHVGVHEGERVHGCGTGFTRKEDLKRHEQTHGDESTQLTRL